MAKHIEWKELPEADRFERLRVERKHLVDTVKLIAYRAETALMHVVWEKLVRPDDVRALLRELFRSTADLRPDLELETLTVKIHPLTSHLQNEAVRHLAAELTATETVFPGTELRMIYEIPGSSWFHEIRSSEVQSDVRDGQRRHELPLCVKVLCVSSYGAFSASAHS